MHEPQGAPVRAARAYMARSAGRCGVLRGAAMPTLRKTPEHEQRDSRIHTLDGAWCKPNRVNERACRGRRSPRVTTDEISPGVQDAEASSRRGVQRTACTSHPPSARNSSPKASVVSKRRRFMFTRPWGRPKSSLSAALVWKAL